MEATSKIKGKRRKQQQTMTQNAKRLLKRSKPSEKKEKSINPSSRTKEKRGEKH
jgi:hypothetical protein